MSSETFLYNDIPIDLTDCAVSNPDTLSSADQFRLPENTKAFLNLDEDYYYPDGEGDDPFDMKENCRLTRYRPFFLRSGTSLTFLAWVGDSEISVYRTEPNDENYVPAAVFQHGNLSDLTWAMKSSDVGIVILLWIGVIFIIVVLILTSYQAAEEETPPPAVKKGNKKRKSADKPQQKLDQRRINTNDTHTFCLPWKYMPKHNGSECAPIYGEQCGTCRTL